MVSLLSIPKKNLELQINLKTKNMSNEKTKMRGVLNDFRKYETSHGRVEYDQHGKTYYGWIVEVTDVKNMMNGQNVNDLKEVQVYTLSEDESAWMKVGTEIEFEHGFTKSGNERLFSVKDRENAKKYSQGKNATGGTSTYNDPISIERSAMSMAGSIAIKYCETVGETPDDIAFANMKKHIKKWMLQEGNNTRDIVIARYHCLEQAIDGKKIGIEMSNSSDLFKLANKYYDEL